MTPLECLQLTVKKLNRIDCSFALAGGMIASLYRKEIRATNDVDIMLMAASNTQKIAKEIIESFSMKAGTARLAQISFAPSMNKKRSPIVLMVGRDPNNVTSTGLDFILPGMPWFNKAMERAQYNRIDFGFSHIPSMTVEDVIVSKCFALKQDTSRFKDLDDLQSIFQAKRELDLAYLCAELERLNCAIPKTLFPVAPIALRVLSKRILKG